MLGVSLDIRYSYARGIIGYYVPILGVSLDIAMLGVSLDIAMLGISLDTR